jgi:hypothetical protein
MGRKQPARQAATEKGTAASAASDVSGAPVPLPSPGPTRQGRSASVTARAERSNFRIRLQKSRLRYLQRQIEEFYGPLSSVVSQILVANQVRSHLTEQNLSAAILGKVDGFLYEQYFRDLHQKVSDILSSKLYLVDGVDLPDSYYVYLQHAMQEKVQLDLWRNLQVDTSSLKGIPFPNQFLLDIRRDLEQKMKEYDAVLRELHGLVCNPESKD